MDKVAVTGLVLTDTDADTTRIRIVGVALGARGEWSASRNDVWFRSRPPLRSGHCSRWQ